MENPRVEGASVNNISSSEAANELRYALDVMEEYSHLGLDDEYAGKLRDILVRRIEEAEDALSVEPAHPVRFGVPALTRIEGE
jgi:hypothetical protein